MATTSKGNHEWLMYVSKNLKENESEAPETESRVCIFGIAHPFSRLKPESYIPQVISIGPYHHRALQQYEETDTYKLKMARTMERKAPGRLKELVEHIMSLDGRIRACYHKLIPYNKEMLSWMLALDTCFILQFLESIYTPYTNNPDNVEKETSPLQSDPILDSKRNTPLWYAIRNDILMLENQVPMFLLKDAFCFTTKFKHSDTQMTSQNQLETFQGDAKVQNVEHLATILQAACVHFHPFVGKNNHSPPSLELDRRTHVLDCLYYLVAGSAPQTKGKADKITKCKPTFPSPRGLIQSAVHRFIKWMISTTTAGNFPSATVLSEVGIKFAPYDSGNLSEIRFDKSISTFFLPKITINDSTEAVLRNLVALELNLKTEQKPLTRYTYLMDRLIDTERDVAVLKRCGVLNCHMGSDAEVAQMWNSMSKSTWENKFEYVESAIEEADKFYRNKWRVMFAQFMKAHCSKPWLVVSVLSAGILLLLTTVQVFCLFYNCNKYPA